MSRTLPTELIEVVTSSEDGTPKIWRFQLKWDYPFGHEKLLPRMETPKVIFDEKTGTLTVYEMP